MFNDPLLPVLSSFKISEKEQLAIDHALSLKDSWDLKQPEMKPVRKVLTPLRKRIRDVHLQRQGNLCCYCRTNLHNVGDFMVDREHIIPKSHSKKLTYVLTNLSVACKRCNMEIKKDKLGFLVNPADIENTHLDKNAYHLIHPNFEVYENFISRRQNQHGRAVLVKYEVEQACAKTDYMFYFFKLKDLELNSFDAAQGISAPTLDQSLMHQTLLAEMKNDPALVEKLLKIYDEHQAEKAVTALGSFPQSLLPAPRPKTSSQGRIDDSSMRVTKKVIRELPGGRKIRLLALPSPRNKE